MRHTSAPSALKKRCPATESLINKFLVFLIDFVTQVDAGEYEVVCPNTVLGCDHSCPRSALTQHLEHCYFTGERRGGQPVMVCRVQSVCGYKVNVSLFPGRGMEGLR